MKVDVIYNQDCLKGMPSLPEEFADLAITDPPFNIGKLQSWPADKYREWLGQVSGLIYRRLKENSSLLIELPKVDVFRLRLFEKIEEAGFAFRYPIILYTTNNMLGSRQWYTHYSLCLWFSKGKGRKRYRYPDVIKASMISTKRQFSCPQTKNVRHYERLVDLFSDRGDTILDPFMGSGTTALACKGLGRHYIGFEIDPKYCEIARKRLSEVQLELL